MATKAKNIWGKSRPKSNPYAVLVMNGGWEWRILKAYKSADATRADPHARFFCAVQSPLTHGGWDFGDCYAKDVPGGVAAFLDDTHAANPVSLFAAIERAYERTAGK